MSRLDEIEKRVSLRRKMRFDTVRIDDTFWLIAELRKSQARVRALEATKEAYSIANEDAATTIRLLQRRLNKAPASGEAG